MSEHHLIIQKAMDGSAALPLAQEALGWLTKSGMLEEGYPINLDGCSVLYATEPGKTPPVGVLCFRSKDRGIVVELLYVEPSRRRTGLFRKLMASLYAHAERNQSEFLEITVAAQNEAALNAIEALGFDMAAYRYNISVGSDDGGQGRILGQAGS